MPPNVDSAIRKASCGSDFLKLNERVLGLWLQGAYLSITYAGMKNVPTYAIMPTISETLSINDCCALVDIEVMMLSMAMGKNPDS